MFSTEPITMDNRRNIYQSNFSKEIPANSYCRTILNKNNCKEFILYKNLKNAKIN